MIILQTKDLKKYYGAGDTQVRALDGVDLQVENGEFVVMVTDGVMDALPAGEQEELMETFLLETATNNPKELAHHLLGRVLERSGELPTDDMTILAVGIWKR